MCLVFIPLIGVILYEIVKVISLCKGYKVQRDLEILERNMEYAYRLF